jgi:hypothetical protein
MEIKNKRVLDVCCGARMAWYQKDCSDALFLDIRTLEEKLSNGQTIKVAPDAIMDFRKLDLPSKTFSLVFFDPPHLTSLGPKSWMAKKYGVLDRETGRQDIKAGFNEYWRVLKKNGVLVLKWSLDVSHPSRSIPVTDLIKVIGRSPLFGTRPGPKNSTYWLVFIK